MVLILCDAASAAIVTGGPAAAGVAAVLPAPGLLWGA